MPTPSLSVQVSLLRSHFVYWIVISPVSIAKPNQGEMNLAFFASCLKTRTLML